MVTIPVVLAPDTLSSHHARWCFADALPCFQVLEEAWKAFGIELEFECFSNIDPALKSVPVVLIPAYFCSPDFFKRKR